MHQYLAVMSSTNFGIGDRLLPEFLVLARIEPKILRETQVQERSGKDRPTPAVRW
jgi:hypothetical protein